MARPLAVQTPAVARRRRALSLHAQVALVIAVLSFLPNLVLVLTVFGPTLGRLEGADAKLWLPLGLWLLAVAGLSGGIGYVLARQLLKPLSRMGQQIAALRRRAERLAGAKLPIEANEPQETLELKASFNDLLAQVNLEQSRRSAFMATLVHDLKTPLIASGHLLAVVRDTDTLPKHERIELVGQILRENQGLLELVQKLVDAYKLEHEDVVLKRESVQLSALVENVLARVQPLAESRGVALKCEGQARAEVDPQELERALYNLVSNAVRYARSAIEVTIYPGLIRLADDGPGLPAPLEHLAQPFNSQPLEIAGQRFTAGTAGLGLFLARRIVETHGGRLVTESSTSKGTVLLVYLGHSGGSRG
jgi:signal transduction histidine kinase